MTGKFPLLSRRVCGTSQPIMQVMKKLGTGADHDLTQGIPFFGPPEDAIDMTMQDTGFCHRYGPDDGDMDLKKEIAAKISRENGFSVDPHESIMVTSGANMGFLNAAAAVCDPGDDLVLLSPYYFNHYMTLDMLGIEKNICPLDEDMLPDPDAIGSCIGPRTRGVVFVSPNNPCGTSYPENIVREIVDLCIDKGLWLISDETYDRFVYSSAHTSPASVRDDAPVISLFSFSKVFGISGWRIGYMTYPEHLHGEILKVQDTTVICPSRISQRLAYHCLKDHPDHVDAFMSELDRSRKMLMDWSASKNDIFGPEPTGAFYLFFKYQGKKRYKNSMELAEDVFRRTGVLLVPGDPFGASDPPSLRISYGNIHSDELEKALEALNHLFR